LEEPRFLTNATTAAGFATFTVVESSMMREFGVVAATSIMFIFVLSLLLVPIVFSFLKAPKARHVKHLDRTYSKTFVSKIVEIVLSYRTRVYWFFGIVVIVGIYGITLITSNGKIVDDFPEDSPVLEDLAFFEKNFNGVMPFEVQINALKPDKALSPATLKRIDKLQDAISAYPQFSRAVSMTEVVKSLNKHTMEECHPSTVCQTEVNGDSSYPMLTMVVQEMATSYSIVLLIAQSR